MAYHHLYCNHIPPYLTVYYIQLKFSAGMCMRFTSCQHHCIPHVIITPYNDYLVSYHIKLTLTTHAHHITKLYT